MPRFLYFSVIFTLLLSTTSHAEAHGKSLLHGSKVYINGENIYLKSTNKIIFIHGDIITPIMTGGNKDVEIYPSSSRSIKDNLPKTCHGSVCLTELKSQERVDESRLIAAGYKLSTNAVSLYSGDFNKNGERDIVLLYKGGRQLLYAIKDYKDGYKASNIQNITDYIAISDVTLEIDDLNSDGYDDIIVYKDGAINTVLYSDKHGVFAKPEAENAVSAVWAGFRKHLKSGDTVALAELFTVNSKPTYQKAFNDIKDSLEELNKKIISINFVSTTPEYAIGLVEYRRTDGNIQKQYVYFLMEDGGWKIEGL
ncbi:hypothetical protein H0A36_26205 [Endozoicomonas sp. SM1973]|uniref:Uncharacterized protein n=1 Tax=Spartinivicinus marinus TaxID=2994442 RepID=A0A853IKA9_9GAMM|nr:hypothetical protein [Spartinivicinus marinus]MCX4030497.1 hypothetical protein [Spartinivicinus marinus]NYZ69515.1 hypothetical protein [Spartinivicinus marinus]